MDSSKLKVNKAPPVQVLAVTGGKGGIGKTCISVNLAIAMSTCGRAVTLLDADLGLANIAVLLGLHPLHNLSHVVQGECSLQDIVVRGPAEINIVPAASGIKMMSQLTPSQHRALVHAFDELAGITDTLIIDTSAGMSESVLSFCSASHEVIVVICNEPTSLTDAYALIKVLNQEYGVSRFRILANMVESAVEAKILFQRLVRVAAEYLDVVLEPMGSIPRDRYAVRAVQRQQPLVLSWPSSPAAIALKELAETVDNWPRKSVASGKLEFFVERMLRPLPDNRTEAQL